MPLCLPPNSVPLTRDGNFLLRVQTTSADSQLEGKVMCSVPVRMPRPSMMVMMVVVVVRTDFHKGEVCYLYGSCRQQSIWSSLGGVEESRERVFLPQPPLAWFEVKASICIMHLSAYQSAILGEGEQTMMALVQKPIETQEAAAEEYNLE